MHSGIQRRHGAAAGRASAGTFTEFGQQASPVLTASDCVTCRGGKVTAV